MLLTKNASLPFRSFALAGCILALCAIANGCQSQQMTNGDAAADVDGSATGDAASDLATAPDADATIDALTGDASDVTPDGSADVVDAGSDPAAAFCAALVQANIDPLCNYLQRCCSTTEAMNPAIIDSHIADYCRTRTPSTVCTVPGSVLPHIRFVESAYAACTAAITARIQIPAACGRLAEARQAVSLDWSKIPECQMAVMGQQPLGGDCGQGYECQSGFCSGSQCIAPPTTGSDCTSSPCPDRESCNQSRCATAAGAGASCSYDDNCIVGLFCSGGNDGISVGTCTALVMDGAACTMSSVCASSQCSAGTCSSVCTGVADH